MLRSLGNCDHCDVVRASPFKVLVSSVQGPRLVVLLFFVPFPLKSMFKADIACALCTLLFAWIMRFVLLSLDFQCLLQHFLLRQFVLFTPDLTAYIFVLNFAGGPGC